jgi:hypothetical protein
MQEDPPQSLPPEGQQPQQSQQPEEGARDANASPWMIEEGSGLDPDAVAEEAAHHQEHVQEGSEESGDPFLNRLQVMGIDTSKLLTPEQAAVEQVDEEARRREERQKEDENKWREAVDDVQQDTARLREGLESRLKADVDSGRVKTQDEVRQRLEKIDAEVARGPARRQTYNHSGDPKYRREQTYYATVDEQGNIWGEFEHEDSEIGITGKPIPAGKHMVHSNPTIPKA